MASEQEYDEQIAPELLALAQKAAALGMTFAASVEWAPGETGSTVSGDYSNVGVTQTMTALSARCNRNVDAVLLGLIKRFDVSQSVFLATYNKQEPHNG